RQAAGDAEPNGEIPLTPVMHWARELSVDIDRFHQLMFLDLPADVTADRLAVSLQRVVDEHDALRMRLIVRPDGDWRLLPREPGVLAGAAILRRVDVSALTSDQLAECEREQIHAATHRLDAQRGRMIEAIWFDAGSNRQGGLLLLVHHFAIDGVSWRVLIPALRSAYEGPLVKSGGRESSFGEWAKKLAAEAQTDTRARETAFWVEALRKSEPLFADRPLSRTRDTVRSAAWLTVTLPPSTTGPLLRAVPAAYQGNITDILLTGLAIALLEWRRTHRRDSAHAVTIDLERHGRDHSFSGIDVTQTIGWFTTMFPVRIDLRGIDLTNAWTGGGALDKAVKTVKEQMRRIPDNGIGFGLLRYLNKATAPILAALNSPQIAFNYFGRLQAHGVPDWTLAARRQAFGGGFDPDTPLAHHLDVNALTIDGPDGPRLRVHWTWPSAIITETEVRPLAEGWFHILSRLARLAEAAGHGGRTPSDVPFVSLTQAEIDRLEQAVIRGRGPQG
ncbi:MAG: condensation domain-containing protein, partial [Vicinamibacterales bacterium]